jgi:hypothetical protein
LQNACDYIKPEWFGGIPSPEPDWVNISAEVQKCFDAAPQGATVKFSGFNNGYTRYIFNGITISWPVNVIGDNQYQTLIQPWDTNSNCFTIVCPVARTGFLFRDISISGHSVTGHGYSMKHTGISLTNVVLSSFERVHVGGWGKGICVEQGALFNVPILAFTDCVIGSACSTGIALDLQSDLNTRISNCWFDENYKYGLSISGGKVTVTGCNFQDNTGAHIYMASAGHNCAIVGNTFLGNGEWITAKAIDCYTDNNVISSNVIDTGFTGEPILLRNTSANNVIAGNYEEETNLVSDAGTNNTIHRTLKGRHIFDKDLSDDGYSQIQATRAKFTNSTDAISKDSAAVVLSAGGLAVEKSIIVGDTVHGVKGLKSPKVFTDSLKNSTGNSLAIKATTVHVTGDLRMKYASSNLILDSLAEGINLNRTGGTGYLTYQDGSGNNRWSLQGQAKGLRLYPFGKTGDSALFRILPDFGGYTDSVIINANTADINTTGYFKTTDTTSSTSTTTGALVVSGGVGIAKGINAGGKITTADTLQARISVVDSAKIGSSGSVISSIIANSDSAKITSAGINYVFRNTWRIGDSIYTKIGTDTILCGWKK